MGSSFETAALHQATALARRGWGRVHPNPLVGAVVVGPDGPVADGWHADFGGEHAERVALDRAGDRARGATLVVTLEPCVHHGKQPPCVERIQAAGLARVVVGMTDPNPQAAGGIAVLRAAGIDVELAGDAAAAAIRDDNFRFLHRFSGRKRPYVALKLAVSMDGYLADASGQARWLSSEPSRAWVHWLRAGFAAIGVGAVTAIHDAAQLTVRGDIVPRIPPRRVLFDRSGRLRGDLRIFATAPDVPIDVIIGPDTPDMLAALPQVTVHRVANLEEGLEALAASGVDAILIEGGGRLAGALLEADLVDRVYQLQVPLWLGQGTPAWPGVAARDLATTPRWRPLDSERLGPDTLITLERH